MTKSSKWNADVANGEKCVYDLFMWNSILQGVKPLCKYSICSINPTTRILYWEFFPLQLFCLALLDKVKDDHFSFLCSSYPCTHQPNYEVHWCPDFNFILKSACKSVVSHSCNFSLLRKPYNQFIDHHPHLWTQWKSMPLAFNHQLQKEGSWRNTINRSAT